MKNKLSIVLAALLVTGLLAGDSFAAAENKAIALALKVTGDVQIKKEGSDKKIPLKFGTRLDDGDWIKTGADGAVTLIFSDDKSMLKLNPATEVTISGKRDANSNIKKRVSLEIGQLLTKVDQQRGTLEIATPTSVASVKGTEFWVVVLDDGTTEVFTLGGLVQLLNRFTGNIQDIKPGEKGQSNPDGTVTVEENDEDVPKTPDEALGDDKTIEIKVNDGGGNEKTIQLKYE